MGGAARIGALHVMLGLDSADFTSGITKAKGGLASFGKFAATGFAVVAAAGVAAMGALSFAVKGAIDHFDDMAKTAQRVGLTVEEITRLKYAADLSGVSIGSLSTGVQRLSRNMADIAAGAKGPAAEAMKALGISATDTTGKLRSSQDVLYELADKFQSMPDGANKTAMAIAILGRAGADMIPLLNGGSQALRDMASESDNFGQTVSTRAAKAAEVFNDNMSRLGSMLTGVVNRIAEGVLPMLADLSTKFVQAAADSGILEAASSAIIWVLNQVAKAAVWVTGQVQAMGEMFWWTARAMQQLQQGNFAGAADAIGAGFEAAGEALNQMNIEMAKIDLGMSDVTAPDFTPTVQTLEDVQVAAGGAGASLKQLASDGKAVFEATRTPAEKLALEIERLNGLLNAGAIDWDTYGRAIKMAQDDFSKADTAASSLGETFKDAFKGFATDIKAGKSWLEALGGALSKVADKLWDMALDGLFSMFTGSGMGGGGGGGLLGGLFGGIGKLFGFANGGSFNVGGSGGIDSQLVAFKASPNETVSVTKPGQGTDRALDVRVSLDNAMLKAVVTDEAGRVVGQAAPAIVGASVQQSNKSAPSAMARYQNDQAGSDYRL